MNRQKSSTSNNNGNKKYSVIEMKVNRNNNNTSSDSSSSRSNNISIKAIVLSTYLYGVHSIHWKNIIYYFCVCPSVCVCAMSTHTAYTLLKSHSQNLPIFSRLFCVFACPECDVLWCIHSVCPTFDFIFRMFVFVCSAHLTKMHRWKNKLMWAPVTTIYNLWKWNELNGLN